MLSLTRLVTASVVALGMVQAAQAADLPARVAAPVYAPAPVANWTGFYFGGHLGAGWGTVESSLPLDQFGIPGTLPLASHNVNGFLGGGQLGYNWQADWVLFGVEASFSGAQLEGSAPCIIVFTCKAESKWLANVSGRVGGIVGGNTLLFVKGGFAWKDTDYSASANIGGATFSATGSDTRTGWLVGTGVEYAFSKNWSGFIEYNYMDFGTERVTFALNPPVIATLQADIDDKVHVIKTGVNYRF
jgi:outer membrane immunogenic protein